ncbi:DUF4065 domain-containing protein [soil metagenome]
MLFHFYFCKSTNEQYTNTELDNLNLSQVYNQYRSKHNLPFPDEIKRIRDKYNLPATKMSEILGFGINSYRNYESGEVPSDSNAKLIKMASDPLQFKNLVNESVELEVSFKEKLIGKIVELIAQEERSKSKFFEILLFNHEKPDEYCGYRKPDLGRITEMIVFFTEKMEPYKVKMNKILFYVDFLMFKKSAHSISGMSYRAVAMGPILSDYDTIFAYACRNNHVDICETKFPEGGIGEQFLPNSKRKFNKELFSQNEIDVMQEIATKFKKIKTNAIVDMSHKEKGWKENEKKKKLISYNYAFELNQV